MADLTHSRQPQVLASTHLLRPLPAATRLALRGGSQVLGAACDALGLARSELPCRAVRSGNRAALWLGPDERLLIAPAESETEMRELLERALTGTAHSLVDVSHAQSAFEVHGTGASAALNTGCPLDLELTSFPVDMCTRTVFAKAQIVLWRVGPHSFRLETGRSFASYVTGILGLAASEAQA